MYKGYIAIAFFIVRIHISLTRGRTDNCDFFCDVDGCKESANFSSKKYCKLEDISNNINFTLITDENKTVSPHGKLQINFMTLQEISECGVKFSLYANESIGEEECANYNFQSQRNIKAYTEKVICFISNSNQYQNSIYIPVQYIFTACYGIEIYFGSGRFINNNQFLRTNYNRTDILKPSLQCKYDIVPDSAKNKELYFEVDFSTSIVVKATLFLGFIYENKGDLRCFYRDQYKSFNISEQYVESVHENLNTALATNEKFETKMNFTIDALPNTSYCIIVQISDDRCKKDYFQTSAIDVCHLFRECIYLPKHFSINTDSSVSFYLFPWIVLIILITITIIAIMYLGYAVYNCNICTSIICKSTKKYNRINRQKSTNKKKSLWVKDSTLNTDIVLLYPKSSKSVMALMAEFRGMLTSACQCPVHDWHNGIEWNRVAEIGGSDWFTEMLNKGSRVIWLDTPTMRSLIKRRFKKNLFDNSEQFDLTEIGDFRDMELPTVFNLAKRDVEESMSQQHRHFIVRLKQFENCKNDDDPFVDLSSPTRYLIPQDLTLLCSVLSVSKSDEIIPYLRQKEELMKHYIHDVDIDCYE